ncbi:MAG: hypothetical protein ACYDHW_10745 [Syntrophorhabdaceae bacterium]
MVIDIEDKAVETGAFELPGGGKLFLRLLDAKDFKEIRTASLTVKPEYPYLPDVKDGQIQPTGRYHRFEGTDFNNDLFNEMMWDRSITGWSDLFDRNNKEIPCTTDNKVLLMTRSKEFAEKYEEGMKALKEAEEAKKEAEVKNS